MQAPSPLQAPPQQSLQQPWLQPPRPSWQGFRHSLPPPIAPAMPPGPPAALLPPPLPDAAQTFGGHQPVRLAREPRMAGLLTEPTRQQAPAVAGVKRSRDGVAHELSSFSQMQGHHRLQQPSVPGSLPSRGSAGVPVPTFQHAVPNSQRGQLASVDVLRQRQQQGLSAPSPSLRRTMATPALQRTANAGALLRALDNMAGTLTCFASDPL